MIRRAREDEVACEVCASPRAFTAFAVAGYAHWRCRSCRHLFVFPRPEQAVLDRYYANAGYYDWEEAEGERLYAEAVDRVRLVDRYASRLGLPRRVMDVGCATGIFLDAARERGWTVKGMEQSPPLAERARRRGLVIDERQVERGIDEQWPVVTAWDVIEHARDPDAFLRALAATVESGGLLFVVTPHSNGVPARLLGPRFPMVNPPEHLNLFSATSLRWLASRHGLRPVDVRSFSNLSYEKLHRGWTQFLSRCRVPGDGLRHGLAAILAAATLPSVRAVDALKLGIEMQVVFRKGGR